jgi:hypothetical protein
MGKVLFFLGNIRNGFISTVWLFRLLGFAGCLIGAAVCFFVAFITLPLLPIKCVIITICLGSRLIISSDRRSLLLHLGSFLTFYALKQHKSHTTSSRQPREPSGHVWVSYSSLRKRFNDVESYYQVLCSDWAYQPHTTSSFQRAASFLSYIFSQPESHTLLLPKRKSSMFACEFYHYGVLIDRHDHILGL